MKSRLDEDPLSSGDPRKISGAAMYVVEQAVKGGGSREEKSDF